MMINKCLLPYEVRLHFWAHFVGLYHSFFIFYYSFFCDNFYCFFVILFFPLVHLLILLFPRAPSFCYHDKQVVALATAGRRSPFREAVGSPKSLNPLSPDQAQQQLNPNHEPMSPQGFTSSAASNTTAAGNNSNAAGSGNGGGGGGTSSTSNTAPPARSWQVGSFRRGSGNGGSGGNDNEDENDGPDLDNAAGIQVEEIALTRLWLFCGNKNQILMKAYTSLGLRLPFLG